MRVTITARRFKLPENVKSFTQKEVMRLEKYYDGIIDTEVILSWEKFHRLAEINVRVYGTTLTTQEREEDVKKAVKLAVEKMERQLIKYKDKMHSYDHEKPVPETIEGDEEAISFDSEEN